MNSFYSKTEAWFEKLVTIVLRIYGHPLTFLIALAVVIFFLVDKNFYRQSSHDIVRDLMLSITFLSFFLIQKAVNKYTTTIHIKMNELVTAQDRANNELVNIEEKTEEELKEIAEKYKGGKAGKPG
jgi:low affinity Fe/Cu permease